MLPLPLLLLLLLRLRLLASIWQDVAPLMFTKYSSRPESTSPSPQHRLSTALTVIKPRALGHHRAMYW